MMSATVYSRMLRHPFTYHDPTQRLQQENQDLITQAQEVIQQTQEIALLKSRLEQQAAWLDQYHKHKENAIRGRLAEKDQQISSLLQRDSLNTDAISTLSDKLAYVMKEIEILKKNSHF